jgi:phage/plasmid-like protein (TIGR03299 family)
MAHCIDMTNNRANIAFIGETPWHGLGANMPADATLDQWRIAAGLDYAVKRTPAMYQVGDEMLQGEGDILYRSDNNAMLAHVSSRYQVVQPKDVVEFYRDLTDQHGFVMETMGALSDGKRVWALAKVGEGFTIGKNDRIENYLLLATSYDKTMATRCQFTTVRVVCHNTLSMAVASKETCVSVSHSANFDADKVKLDMGIVTASNDMLKDSFDALADRKVTDKEAVSWIAKVMFGITDEKALLEVNTRKSNIIHGVFGLYNGKGMGSGFDTAHGTAFGLLNAITEHVDHHAARNANNRLQSAWFGQGENLKAKAFTEALALVA